jgi:hypothetical protein
MPPSLSPQTSDTVRVGARGPEMTRQTLVAYEGRCDILSSNISFGANIYSMPQTTSPRAMARSTSNYDACG